MHKCDKDNPLQQWVFTRFNERGLAYEDLGDHTKVQADEWAPLKENLEHIPERLVDQSSLSALSFQSTYMMVKFYKKQFPQTLTISWYRALATNLFV